MFIKIVNYFNFNETTKIILTNESLVKNINRCRKKIYQTLYFSKLKSLLVKI